MPVSTEERPTKAQMSPDDRVAKGKAARTQTPRESQAALEPSQRDPVALLQEQAAGRVQELLPIRYGRMLASPFSFFRGAAEVMATDLSSTLSSGLQAQLSGDAHLSNFGGFDSPEEDLVFDVNDFDETLMGPWEWDVKRMATSFAVAGRDLGLSEQHRRSSVIASVRSYREAMRRFAEMGNLAVWYSHTDEAAVDQVVRAQAKHKVQKRFGKNVAKAEHKDSLRAFDKLTTRTDGTVKFVSDPPLIVPLQELLQDDKAEALHESLRSLLRGYAKTLPLDLQDLFQSYEVVTMARKVVGVGSVGTRDFVVLLFGRDGKDPLVLQVKEATRSALESFVGKSRFKNHGQRVVEGQRRMQAASDIFLGWIRAEGIDGQDRDFYLRQLWDAKYSVDIDTMHPSTLTVYAELCGSTLARAHARSGDRIAIAAYLGKGAAFDHAISQFAESYADQNEKDYRALGEAVKTKRVPAETGV
jgi:uncharacterized protein (DUF2252 family)